MKLSTILLLIIIVALGACSSRGPKSSVKLSFSLDYQVVLATNKVRVFPVKEGSGVADRTIDYDKNSSPLISLPAGVWRFYSIEWNGATPYTGALKCGISNAVDLKGGAETSIDITPSENNCGAPFFATIFNNYCYQPSTTATTTPFRAGSGTVGDPFIVCNVDQLNSIGGANFGSYKSNHFKLGRNINFYHKFDNIPDALPFVPIGPPMDVTNPSASPSELFTGSFDGAGYSIIGMTLSITATSTALYKVGFIRQLNGTVKNINFVVPEIDTISDSPVNAVGIVAGSTPMTSLIENVHVSYGSVRGRESVGGFVGLSGGQLKIIDSSFFDGEIEGKTAVGGLVGTMHFSGDNILRSFTTGDVRANNGYCSNLDYKDESSCTSNSGVWNQAGQIGGLIGSVSAAFNTGHIKESFSKMDIQGANEVGGLIGRNNASSTALDISDSYSVGNIHSWGGSTPYLGGIIGYNQTAAMGKLTRVFHTQGGLSSTSSSSSTIGRLFGGGANGDCYESFATGKESYLLNCNSTNSASVTYVGIRLLSTYQNAGWPISDSAITPTIYEMALGGQHSCVLAGVTAATKKIKCWGGNGLGQLGDGTYISKLIPTDISSANFYSKVSTGSGSSCGLTATGALHCWGNNSFGQLGNGTTASSSTPVSITSSSTWINIDAGGDHTCGITDTNSLYCWGLNSSGEVGVATSTTVALIPQAITGTETYSTISAGIGHSCAITSVGILKCWGDNSSGQLGNGNLTSTSTPTMIGSGYAKIANGQFYTCGITTAGILKCWGENSAGQLGIGASSATPSATPQIVDSGVSYSKVATGNSHTCAITSGGVLKCWGWGAFYQNGSGNYANTATPTVVDAGVTYTDLSLSNYHSCGLTSSGIVKCWGKNSSGQINGTLADVATPTAVSFNSTWIMDDNLHDYPRLAWETPRGCHGKFSGTWGSGTAADPYQICSRDQFNSIDSSPGASYVMNNDIDLLGVTPHLTNYFTNNFQGNLDGNEHTISNLAITATSGVNGVGLFPSIDIAGSVSDIQLKGVDIKLSAGSNAYMGSIAGDNYGTISEVRAQTGVIEGDYYVGGIVGKNLGTLSKVSSNLMMKGNYYLGGLVGENEGGLIEHSHSYGSIKTSSTSDSIGGLVGRNLGDSTFGVASILGSFSRANISLNQSFSSTNIGGLVGSNTASGAAAIINDSYAAASIKDENTSLLVTNLGGLIGQDTGGTINRTFSYSYVSSSVSAGTLPSNWGPFVGYVTGGASKNYSDSLVIENTSSVLNSYGGHAANTASYTVASYLNSTDAKLIGSYIGVGWNVVEREPTSEDEPTTVWGMEDGKSSYPELLHANEGGKGLDFMKTVLGY